MRSFILIFMFFTGAFVFFGCKEDYNDGPVGKWYEAVFIVNEGPFQTGTGTISSYNRATGEVSHDLFENANGRPLGNIVQSMAVFHDKVYIIVHLSNKMEVAHLENFKSDTTLLGLTLPRYFLGVDEEKGFVSCWDNTVQEINLKDFSIVREIQTGEGPDEMIRAGETVFVINSGGYGTDSTVTYFSINSEEDFGKLAVGHRPSGIVKDIDGNIWVLCSGKGWNGFPAEDDTPARLVCIDPASKDLVREFVFPGTDDHPENLVVNPDGTILYYIHPSGVFEFPVHSGALQAEPLVPATVMFYGLGFDPGTRLLYVTDPLDYAQNGWVYRYDPLNGNLVDFFQAGMIPNGFWFN